jgi:hypothetical protein
MPRFGGREFSLDQLFKIRDSMEGLSDDQKRMLLAQHLYGNGDFSGIGLPGIESKYLQVKNGMTNGNDGVSLDNIFNSEEEIKRLQRRHPSTSNVPSRVPIIRGHPFKGYL